jgi:hypothetical protein
MIWFSLHYYHHFGLYEIRQALSPPFFSFFPFLPNCRGGFGKGQGRAGENGTVTGKACPKGLFGTFCEVDSINISFNFLTSFKVYVVLVMSNV